MGYNTETALLILDLETAPCPEAASFLDPLPMPEVQPVNRSLKDPAKIAADLEAKQAAHVKALEQWERDKVAHVAACALNPDLAQIICIGACRPTGPISILTARNDIEEAEAIGAIAEDIGPATIVVGFNVRFDLSMLMRRALYLGVPFPKFNLDKYRAGQLIDLQDILTFQNYLPTKGRSLDFYRRRFRLDVPEDTTGGGEAMPRLFAAGDWGSIRQHCTLDVLTTRLLAERLGVITPAPVEMAF